MQENTTIDATLANVSSFTQQLESKLDTVDFASRTVIILAIHELLVNVVEHAYDGKHGKIDIQVAVGDMLKVLIRDYASQGFDIPETIKEPDPLDLPENGMGLFIIYDTFDAVTYQRLEDGNQWELEKALGDDNG